LIIHYSQLLNSREAEDRILLETQRESVADFIVECIDQSLSDLENVPALLIYKIAEESFGVSKEEIPKKPEAFEEALELTLGSRSVVVEMEMRKLIVEAFHLREECSYHGLPQLIAEIMNNTNSVEDELFDTWEFALTELSNLDGK
jgi:hypothetical protein